MRTRDIDPDLPWGHWLAIRTSGRERIYVGEATGKQWRTLRSAFWHGRLGMPNDGKEPPPEQLELMHAVLTARARRHDINEREEVGDVFQGSGLFRDAYLRWLRASGLTAPSGDGHAGSQLTAEGWSALAMLRKTRPYSQQAKRPSGMTVRDLIGLGMGPEEREVRLAGVEKIASSWEAAFLRRMDDGEPSVILTKRGGLAWTLAFEAVEPRDNFYEWLCFRMDRWPAWAEFADRSSSGELTRKLLAVMAASLQPYVPQAPPLMREEYR